MKHQTVVLPIACTAVIAFALAIDQSASGAKPQVGKQIFRFDTFGDEQLWTDTLDMPHALASVSPATALKVGLKVDRDALPRATLDAIISHRVTLDDPAVTVSLLSLNAVVGVIGHVSSTGALESVGIT